MNESASGLLVLVLPPFNQQEPHYLLTEDLNTLKNKDNYANAMISTRN